MAKNTRFLTKKLLLLTLPIVIIFVIAWSFSLIFKSPQSTNSPLTNQPSKPVNIVCSFSILQDMAQQLLMNIAKVNVTTLVPLGQDPHIYEPRPGDVVNIAKADLIIVNGLGFEGWIERLIHSSGYTNQIIIATQQIKNVRRLRLNEVETPDPHVWHHPEYGLSCIKTIEKALINILPQHQKEIKKNAERIKNEINQIDQWAKTLIHPIALIKRRVITTHDAFSYLGAYLDITFIAPLGISTQAQPTPTQIAYIIDQIKH